MNACIPVILAGLFFVQSAFGSPPQRQLTATRFASPPQIDGEADGVWEKAGATTGFVQLEPRFGTPASVQTEVRMGFDDEAIFVLFVCHDPDPERISAAITKRDGSLEEDDTVVLMIDSFDDDSTAYYFACNLLGTQEDGRLGDNGRSVQENWDAAWECAGGRHERGWIAEFRIPFRILKYPAKEGAQTWGVNMARIFPRNREWDLWSGPSEDFWRVSRFGALKGLQITVQKTKRYEIIPYAITRFQEGQDADGEIGIDLRYRLANSIGADLTINPDFATVEADAEEVNLTRFERSVSEKRPFFLEGNEFFEQRIRQFYSRRIGDIPWGTKLSGKASSVDFSLMTAQSDPTETAGELPSEDATYSVIRAKKVVLGRSNIGFLATNRRYQGEDRGSVGLDATLFFTETLGMTAQFIRAHGGADDGQLAWFIRPSFDSANSHFHVRYTNLDENLMENMNASGFLQDDNRKEFDTNFSHTFWIDRESIDNVELGINYNRYKSQEDVLRSWQLDTVLEVSFSNGWEIELEDREEFKRYEKDFRNSLIGLGVEYDTRRGRSIGFSYARGENFDNDVDLIGVFATFKFSDAWSASYGLEKLDLDPDPEDESTLIHILRTDYYFQKDLFLKLFYQTNSAIDKKNTQAVLVWRFIPPFGAVHVAYQKGTSRFGTRSDQGHTLFAKLSWVF